MPLYDYKCTNCDKTFEQLTFYEDRSIDCKFCGKEAKRQVSKINHDSFKPQHFEELGDDCPFIETKQQLADECRKRGLYSRYIEDSYNTHKPKREI